MDGSVGILAAFAAGVVSFLSPCVLPLIPGYLSFITGYTPSELSDRSAPWRSVLVPSLLFVAGFSIVFIGLGASASVLGSILMQYRTLLVQLSGALVFVLGFFMLGIVRLPWLYGEARFELGKAKSFGKAAAMVMGMAFAFGWTPCVGPILGSILALASSSGSVSNGVTLLVAYSLGLGVPFIATALLFGQLRGALSWLNRHALAINRVAGILLMVVGALIFTGQLARLAGWLTTILPAVELV
ncbi:MAG: cytochrome C biogenesis protein [Actinobacteria bacterium HGW-Actinobacteria-10]|nr:MAG: cytochrome C biogenesis protein [Actinobacteria bacterium HGW-Actinobacteria-10]